MSVSVTRDHVSPAVLRPARRVPNPVPGGTAFSINFVRRQTVPLAMRRVLAMAAVGYLAMTGAVLVVLLGWTLLLHVQGRQAQAAARSATAVASVAVLRDDMDALRRRAVEDTSQLAAIISQQQQRFPTAGKLAALTKTLPARTWIASLRGTREQHALSIRATYVVDREHPLALPTKEWMAALRQEPVFSHGLKRLELGDSSRQMRGQTELFEFELLAEWQ